PARVRRHNDALAFERRGKRLFPGLFYGERGRYRREPGRFPHRKRGATAATKSESGQPDAELLRGLRPGHLESDVQADAYLRSSLESLLSDVVQTRRCLQFQPGA